MSHQPVQLNFLVLMCTNLNASGKKNSGRNGLSLSISHDGAKAHKLNCATTMSNVAQLLLLSALALPVVYILARSFLKSSSTSAVVSEEESEKSDEQPKSVMSPENSDLAPPKDDPFTLEQLKVFDGSDPSKPIYVAIKGAYLTVQQLVSKTTTDVLCSHTGTIFDVSAKKEMYGPGKSYNIFAGKDGSKGLGLSSLKVEDAIPDYSSLPPAEMKVLDDWHAFFTYVNIYRRFSVSTDRVADIRTDISALFFFH